jgi:hypothetical protein
VDYVLALAALALAAAIIYEVSDAARSHLAARWQCTPGQLKRWDIHSDVDTEHTRILIRDIEYTYCVAGQDYKSSRLGFGFPTHMSALYVEKTLKGLLKSAPDVLVFFDPANPARSVLTVGVRLHHLIRIVGMGFVLAVVVYLLRNAP